VVRYGALEGGQCSASVGPFSPPGKHSPWKRPPSKLPWLISNFRLALRSGPSWSERWGEAIFLPWGKHSVNHARSRRFFQASDGIHKSIYQLLDFF